MNFKLTKTCHGCLKEAKPNQHTLMIHISASKGKKILSQKLAWLCPSCENLFFSLLQKSPFNKDSKIWFNIPSSIPPRLKKTPVAKKLERTADKFTRVSERLRLN